MLLLSSASRGRFETAHFGGICRPELTTPEVVFPGGQAQVADSHLSFCMKDFGAWITTMYVGNDLLKKEKPQTYETCD